MLLFLQAIFTSSCTFIIIGVDVGIGKHNDAIADDETKVRALMVSSYQPLTGNSTLTRRQWQALATATYVMDMMFIKMSIGIFLLRLSVQRRYSYTIIVSLVIICIWSTVTFIWDIFQCKPVEKQWDFRIEGGYCVSASEVVSAAYAISVMTILSDWLFVCLPLSHATGLADTT